MIITSDLRHLHTFALSTQKDNPGESVQTLRVVPGANVLNDSQTALWKKLKENDPDVKRLLEERLLIEVQALDGEGKPIDLDKLPKSLKSMAAPQAILLVQGVSEADILRSWLEGEDRETVRTAIKKQLEMVLAIDQKRAEAVA